MASPLIEKNTQISYWKTPDLPSLRSQYLPSVKNLVGLHRPHIFGLQCHDSYSFDSSCNKLNLKGSAVLVTICHSADSVAVRMGEKGIERCRKFTWDAFVQQIDNGLDKIASS